MISVIILVPLGVLMGIPFPTGLRAISTEGNVRQPDPLESCCEPVTASSTIEWA